jgi:hypothetical protein
VGFFSAPPEIKALTSMGAIPKEMDPKNVVDKQIVAKVSQQNNPQQSALAPASTGGRVYSDMTSPQEKPFAVSSTQTNSLLGAK